MLASILQEGESRCATEVVAKGYFVSVILTSFVAVDFRDLVNALPDLQKEIS